MEFYKNQLRHNNCKFEKNHFIQSLLNYLEANNEI